MEFILPSRLSFRLVLMFSTRFLNLFEKQTKTITLLEAQAEPKAQSAMCWNCDELSMMPQMNNQRSSSSNINSSLILQNYQIIEFLKWNFNFNFALKRHLDDCTAENNYLSFENQLHHNGSSNIKWAGFVILCWCLVELFRGKF